MELQLALVEEPRQVVIGARVIPYTLKVSARAKRMRVTIANGQMSVTVPRGLRLYSVDHFLQEHGQWILAKMEQVDKAKVQPALPKDVILVAGVPMRVERIEEKERKSRARVDLVKDRVIVRVPAGSRMSPLTDCARLAAGTGARYHHRRGEAPGSTDAGKTDRAVHPRPAHPLGKLLRQGRALVQLAPGDGTAGGDAVRGHPRTGASLPAQPFKGFLGGGGQLRTGIQKTPSLAAQERQPAASAGRDSLIQ